MNEGTKSLFASKTFWGAIIAAACGIAGIFGKQIAPDEQASLIDGAASVGVLIGTVVAIVGRMRATTKIGS